MKRIAIIGAGSWGTALAVVAARAGHDVQLWARNADVVALINRDHLNSVYLTGISLPPSVRATGDIRAVLNGAELVILAAPSHATRSLLTDMLPALQRK